MIVAGVPSCQSCSAVTFAMSELMRWGEDIDYKLLEGGRVPGYLLESILTANVNFDY